MLKNRIPTPSEWKDVAVCVLACAPGSDVTRLTGGEHMPLPGKSGLAVRLVAKPGSNPRMPDLHYAFVDGTESAAIDCEELLRERNAPVHGLLFSVAQSADERMRERIAGLWFSLMADVRLRQVSVCVVLDAWPPGDDTLTVRTASELLQLACLPSNRRLRVYVCDSSRPQTLVKARAWLHAEARLFVDRHGPGVPPWVHATTL